MAQQVSPFQRTLFFAAILGASPLAATVFTVGAGGTHATLAAAVDAANGAPGDDEIRLRPGTYPGGVQLADQGLAISGGWNAGFSQRSANAKKTRIVGAGGTVIAMDALTGATLRLEGLSVLNGEGPGGRSGGIDVNLKGAADLVIDNVVVRNNEASQGGGLFVRASGDGNRAVIRDAVFSGNEAGVYAGGATLEAQEDAAHTTFEVRASRFLQNRVDNDGSLSVGSCPGLCLVSLGGAAMTRLVVEDNVIEENRAQGAAFHQSTALHLSLLGAGDRAELRRNQVLRNEGTGDGRESVPQVYCLLLAGAVLTATDNLVAESPGSGIAVVTAGGTARLVNWTIADNRGDYGVSVSIEAGGKASLANSIVVGSDTAFVGTTEPLVQVANLAAGDPRFVDRDGGNYRLRRASPAVDKGKKKPPGKLGPADLDGTARIKGGKVDIGAYESF